MRITDQNAFGVLLRETRLAADKTCTDVARHLDISVSYVSDVERGSRAPFTRQKILAVAAYLDCDSRPLLAAMADYHGAVTLPLATDGTPRQIVLELLYYWDTYSPAGQQRLLRLLKEGL